MLFQLIRSGADAKEIAFILILYFLALSLAFAGHEFAHSFAAHLMGDDTSKFMGRMTLNPLAHIDPKGILLLILVGFGWGKPVPVNPSNYTRFKSKRLMGVIVDLAGVAMNFIMAFVAEILYAVVNCTLSTDNMWVSLIIQFLGLFYSINILLLAFNLIPINPLDGFNFWVGVLPVKLRYTNFFRNYCKYAPIVLFVLIIAGMVMQISVLDYILDLISFPFEMIIGFVVAIIYIAFGKYKL